MIYDFVFAMSAESDLACTSLPNRSENVSTSYFKDELFVTFFAVQDLLSVTGRIIEGLWLIGRLVTLHISMTRRVS